MKRIVAIFSVLSVLAISGVAGASASASTVAGLGASIECTEANGAATYKISYGHGMHTLEFTFGEKCLL